MIASVVPLNGAGRALRPAILYYDQRSVPQVEAMRGAVGHGAAARIAAITGNRVVPGNTSATSMLWIAENEPEVYARTEVFALANTFICR